jgi:hypothetical protein
LSYGDSLAHISILSITLTFYVESAVSLNNTCYIIFKKRKKGKVTGDIASDDGVRISSGLPMHLLARTTLGLLLELLEDRVFQGMIEHFD